MPHLAALIVIHLTITGCSHQPGVTAIIKNADPDPLSKVVVIVIGKTYGIGDIPPNQSASVVVRPQGESDITVEYTDASGTKHSLPVDCYIESGYRGSITVEISGNQIVNVGDHVRPGTY